MKWRVPRIWLLVSAAVAAALVAFWPEEDASAKPARNNPPASTSAAPQAAPPKQPPQPGRVELERLSQNKAATEDGKPVSNAFKSTSWYVAPPPPPPPPPPPRPVPTAPPLPFTYLGRYEDPSKLVVMLASGGKLYTVSQGEVIDGTYRIERITRETVDFIYLPLNIRQSLGTIVAPDNVQNRVGAENRRP